jgi:hypothetical protein
MMYTQLLAATRLQCLQTALNVAAKPDLLFGLCSDYIYKHMRIYYVDLDGGTGEDINTIDEML